ncbi:chorismate mutase [Mycolicibacterium goodii]|uniref:Chorismate mutase n=1 Tax=Mycolicibacterium goodii TaxID=134601 RepID=A0A0K0XH41_MYCGD|nr:chorismate mutase [Mycolicibacterium goodii]
MFASVLLAALAGVGAPHASAEDTDPLLALVDAAAQRLQTADPVAASKFRSGGAIDDPEREQQVIAAVTADATRHDIDPGYVHDVFRNQIDATSSVEHTRFAQWKLDPAAAPTSAPDLAASRQKIDTLNRTMVDEIARQWPVLHSPACRPDLDRAIDAVAAARGFDPVYRRALEYATHSYCR